MYVKAIWTYYKQWNFLVPVNKPKIVLTSTAALRTFDNPSKAETRKVPKALPLPPSLPYFSCSLIVSTIGRGFNRLATNCWRFPYFISAWIGMDSFAPNSRIAVCLPVSGNGVLNWIA